jgi:hypothetical protein
MLAASFREPRVLVGKAYNKVASFKAAEYLVSITDLSSFALDLHQLACRGVSRGFEFVDATEIADPVKIDTPPAFLSDNNN